MKLPFKKKRPLISVVIIAYNMAREIPRTVQSFLSPYQTGIAPDDVEVIVMENGSSHPVPENIIASWPDNVRYIKIEAGEAKSSPAHALNQGVKLAHAPWVCPVIDGARMVTPGVFQAVKELISVAPNPVITTMGYHLGHKPQQQAVLEGYNQIEEDKLLQSINWPQTPYKLFDIASLGGSAKYAWLAPISESNVLVLKKRFYAELGGYDEAFDIPGGGLVNLDFFYRTVMHPTSRYILLIGEASFHQYHGGVTTSRSVNTPDPEDKGRTTWEIYNAQYKTLRGHPFRPPDKTPTLYGEMSDAVRRILIKAATALDNA